MPSRDSRRPQSSEPQPTERPARKPVTEKPAGARPKPAALPDVPQERRPRRVETQTAAPTGRAAREKPQLEIGEIRRLKLEAMTAEGECVAHLGTFVVFVAEGIPGEFVDVAITSIGRDFARARVVKAAEKSQHRVTPRCKHFGVCGGCLWQQMDYSEQLFHKDKLLRLALEHRLEKLNFPIRPMLGSPSEWGTRSKIFYQLAALEMGKSQKVVMGHNRFHSPIIEPIKDCPVHHHGGDEIARLVFHEITARGIPIATPNATRDGLKSILVRASRSTGKAHVVLVGTGPYIAKADGFETQLMKLKNVEGVHLNIQPDPASTYLGPETKHLAGATRLTETIAGVDFQISPDAFFQTNTAAAEKLCEVVLRAVADKACDPILDLYSGGGLLSLPLAKRGRRVVAVEENKRSIEDGIETARVNKITTCEFVQSRVESFIKKLPRTQKFHTIILDPPREGCAEWLMRLIGRGLRPKRIVYVSCNPQALAGDLAGLTQSGYRIDEIQPIDMFPHTAHIESVAILSRK